MNRRYFLAGSLMGAAGTSASGQTDWSRLSSAIPDWPAAADGSLPELDGAVAWLNTSPLSRKSLRGKIVLVNFWTYSCINSLRPLPFLKSWAAQYRDAGLVVLGVHTPEFAFEKRRENVEWALREYKITYPVAMDSDYRIWRAFGNEYWPAFYIVDGTGRIRHHRFGEGEYGESERTIRGLLKEHVSASQPGDSVVGQGVEAPPGGDVRSPETYIGYRNAERFSSPERVARDAKRIYSAPARWGLNRWGLSGSWEVKAESGLLREAHGGILFRFHSRDLHLVLGPAESGQHIPFRVTLDSGAPGEHAGTDIAADGTGEVREPRLYQLIRQKGAVADRTFGIEFLQPGVDAFAFTFG